MSQPQYAKPVRRKYLTAEEYRKCESQIRKAISKQLESWLGHGWSVSGKGNRLRVKLRVDQRLLRPRLPVGTIPLSINGKRTLLKLAVEASHGFAQGFARAAGISGGSDEPRGLAPGCPIRAGRSDGTGHVRGGVSAILKVDEELHVLTCGHIFSGQRRSLYIPGRSAPVGTLRRNFLNGPDAMDIALVRLNSAGRDLLYATSAGPTWTTKLTAPDTTIINRDAVLWCTHPGGQQPRVAQVISHCATETLLFDPPAGLGLVQTERCSLPGDSGAPLMLDATFLGLCAGGVGSFSFFTSTHAAWLRVRHEFGNEVFLWKPN
jgi:hypothetical protein